MSVDSLIPEQDENTLYEHYRFEVDKGQSLLRIDKYLMNRIERASRSKIQGAAMAGNIRINGKSVKPSYLVKPGDVISILLTFPVNAVPVLPEKIDMEIIFEDSDIIVINKKAGMVVHPAYGNFTGTLVNALTYHLQEKGEMSHADGIKPRLVHRIDKDTSGILVISKNDLAMSRLTRQFQKHTIERKYVALVWGDFRKREGTITGNVGRDPGNRKIMKVYSDLSHGKEAITHYKVLERFGYVTLVECKLETGRTHQIRVHMKHIGHPVFNDMAYGGSEILKGTTFSKYRQFVMNCFKIIPRQALHAKVLGFRHPTTGDFMFFESDFPGDMQKVLEKWRLYATSRELAENGDENDTCPPQ